MLAIGLAANAALATEIRIDFGDSSSATSSSTGKYWNNLTNAFNGTLALRDYSSGTSTAWSVGVTKPFILGSDGNGTTSPTGSALSLAPASATRDSFVTLGGYSPGQITLRNLDVTQSYNLGFVRVLHERNGR